MEWQKCFLEIMGLNNSFWENKRVFLTGHTGFKGSWLSLWLSMLGAKISGFSLAPKTEPNMFDILNVSKYSNDMRGDIKLIERLTKLLKYNSPEILIHMAAQPLVKVGIESPVETYATNIMGTVNLLESALLCDSIKIIIVVTSDKCYENSNQRKKYYETDNMGGDDPYSSSKGCAELVTSAYRTSYFMDKGIGIATVRSGNVIGGGDWSPDRLIPDIIRAFNDGKNVIIRNQDAIRPWQHVLEPLSGYLTLCEKLWDNPSEYSEGWNFGPDSGGLETVKMIAEYAAIYWGENVGLDEINNKEFHEAKYLQLNSDKAIRRLDWKAKMNWKSALEITIDWYRAYFNGGSMYNYTKAQICNYMKL
jgi:CDP-glucose 4,6-dehydratase